MNKMFIIFFLFCSPMETTLNYNADYLQFINNKENITFSIKSFSLTENIQLKGYSTKKIYGIYGYIQLHGKYILAVDKAEKRFEIEEYPIYEIKQIKIIPIKNDGRDNSHLLLIMDFFKMPGIYFSKYNLFQNNYNQKINTEFILNYNLMENFNNLLGRQNSLSLNCIMGYVGKVNIKDVEVILISRRSVKNIGTRYNRRGVNKEGYAANTVETEQIVIKDDKKLSYLQLRGSIPFRWKQLVGIKYVPEVAIEDSEYFKIADTILREKYKNIFYLKLTNTLKIEKPLSLTFKNQLEKHKKQYFWFDLAKEGVKDDISKMEKLLKVTDEINKIFYNDNNEQSGIIRTNCLDSLDRTNISQYFISTEIFKQQLEECGIEYTEDIKKEIIKLWIENGNNLSYQYTSTPFLASHVIDGNKRLIGSLMDGVYSLKRYIVNRFSDGRTQTAYDLATGNFYNLKPNITHIFSIKHLIGLFLVLYVIIYQCCYKKPFLQKSVLLIVLIMFLTVFYMFFNYFIDYPEYIEK